MKTKLFTGVAFAAMMIPGAAFAQSTGSQDFDQGDVVVTAARPNKGIAGVQIPDSTKAKGVLTQEFITKQTPGNTILDTINMLPGVSFQNNDPFGSAGGTLTIRGFDSSRISLTFDGVPLNDSGNYAVYSNQQLDPELIEQVNVNYGSTDVDSPTAAASGSTVNYRTVMPTDKFGARFLGSVGDFNFFRVFGQVNTGAFTSFGTKAWFAASSANNNVVFNDFGKINKSQFNARIYQPIGSNGDFVSLSGNYNVNRNNFFGSQSLSLTAFPSSRGDLPYHVARCNVATANYGVADIANSCGSSFDERYNPSNTGNVRLGSKFTIMPNLILTVDAAFQYVKANGGGTVTAFETSKTIAGVSYQGFIGGKYYFGRDINGDGDTLDTVRLLAPSQTVTHRYDFMPSLRYDIDDNNMVRVSYSHEYARHRQTGELGELRLDGAAADVFPINDGLRAGNGFLVEKRDRLSYATLDQVSGEYRGTFGALTVNLGVRAPWYTRKLNNYCFTTSSSGFVDCLGLNNTAANTTYAAANPGYGAPGSRTYKYNRVLPNGGLSYKFAGHFTAFVNYSKGLQVPGTDNLYQDFYFARNDPAANPTPETTDNFDAGIRYTTSTLQLVVNPWFTRFTNRLASSYDLDTQTTTYRNLGRVDKYGIDGNISWRPIPQVTAYVFASYLKSKIKDNVLLDRCVSTATANCATVGAPIYALTAGKRESGSPTYTFGGVLSGSFGPVDLSVQAKRTGPRYLNDQDLPALGCSSKLVNQVCTGTVTTLYPAKSAAYTQVDLSGRLKLGWAGLNDTTYLQINVQNVFNKLYVGGFSGGATTQYSVPFAQIGSPRAFIATLNVQL